MKDITWIQPYYHIILQQIPKTVKSILDVGAGYGILGYILHETRDLQRLDAIEPFYSVKPHYTNFYKQTWKEWVENNPSKHDVIVCTEVIEHMTKQDACEFLEKSKQYADLIIIATPRDFEEQIEYDGNPLQKHQCVITSEDFVKHDYQIISLDRNLIGIWTV